MRYYVTYAINGRLTMAVDTNGIDAAQDEADLYYMDADLNDMETIDARPVTIEDESGNIVWEA